VRVGGEAELASRRVDLDRVTWAGDVALGPVLAQCSAHGEARPGVVEGDRERATLWWDRPQRRVAPGQTVVLYDGDEVVGSGIAV
jgi:tRNA-specific 2-thiouridylase